MGKHTSSCTADSIHLRYDRQSSVDQLHQSRCAERLARKLSPAVPKSLSSGLASSSELLEAPLEVETTFGEDPECGTLDDVELMMDCDLPYRPFIV